MNDRPDQGFLARWSQRKLAARRAAAEPERQPVPPEPEEPPLPELKLPDLGTLTAESDFRPFLQAGVPADLRREALRKLWRVNPIINSLDGLDDHYCTADFTDRATVVAGLRTAYRVGRGMLDAVERLEAEPRPALAEAEACPPPGTALDSAQAGTDPRDGPAGVNQGGDEGGSSTA